MLGLIWSLVVSAAPPAGCIVEIEGLPAGARPSHRLELLAREIALSDASRIVIAPLDAEVAVRLVGPRFEGVVAGRCVAGAVLRLVARPRPAVLIFVDAPRNLVLRCVSCQGELGARRFLAHELPPFPMDAMEAVVWLELKAPGYRSKRKRLRLLPGENHASAGLTPLS
jgi:hypothetical protein